MGRWFEVKRGDNSCHAWLRVSCLLPSCVHYRPLCTLHPATFRPPTMLSACSSVSQRCMERLRKCTRDSSSSWMWTCGTGQYKCSTRAFKRQCSQIWRTKDHHCPWHAWHCRTGELAAGWVDRCRFVPRQNKHHKVPHTAQHNSSPYPG